MCLATVSMLESLRRDSCICSNQIHCFVTSCKDSMASHGKVNVPFPPNSPYKLTYLHTQKYYLRSHSYKEEPGTDPPWNSPPETLGR